MEQAKKRHKKQPWEIVLKDTFLRNEKPDNPYVTALLYFTVFFLSFLLCIVCIFQLCQISGTSMLNTLENGEYILLLRSSSSFNRGDIVVISKSDENSPTGKTRNIVKRIIAVSGDVIKYELADNTNKSEVAIYIKKKGNDEFEKLEENYLPEPMRKDGRAFENFSPDDFEREYEISEGCVYALGDNRNISQDSRVDGEYYTNCIYGKKFITIKKNSLLEAFLKFLYHQNDAT